MSFAFSIIVTSYNNVRALRHTLDSLRHQAFRDFEVIVADDGSTDGSREMFARFAESRDCNYPAGFAYQRHDGWRLSGVRNLGATLARGEYLLFTDGDQICDENLLDAYRTVVGGPCAAAGVRHYIANSPDEDPESVRSGRRLAAPDRRIAEGKIREGAIPPIQVWGCNCLVQRGVWDALGGFDESYPGWGGEDTDFFHRVERSGHPIFGCPRAAVYHFPPPASAPRPLGRRYWRDVKRHDPSLVRNGGGHRKQVVPRGGRVYASVET